MSFLTDCWYVAGWDDELAAGAMVARTLLDRPVVLFRDAAGVPRALADRCPHRFAPLSRGSLANGVITCGYHGLGFDGSGACVRNPHGPLLAALRVASYPLVEAHRALWIWLGDPARPDPAAIPDLAYLSGAPDDAFNRGYLRCQGHAQLFVDNILDLSHTDYLHPETLGGGSISRTRAQVAEREDGTIHVAWHIADDVPTPLFRQFLPAGTERVDGWTDVEWHAPGVMKLTSGAAPAGQGREGALAVHNLHALTPESETTTHYFFASTRDFGTDDARLNALIGETRARIFATEDEPMIAAQQDRIGDAEFWSLGPVMLRTDEAAVRVRRRMDALIAAERAAQ